MDRASSLIFPGSKTLAGWWRQLAPHQPAALGIGYAFLHRIEAPVNVLCDQPLEPLAYLVLQAISLGETELEQQLHLPRPVLQRILTTLQVDNLAAPTVANRWQLTERGREAVVSGAVPVHAARRRHFPFVERMDPLGVRVGPPGFVALAECVSAPWPVDEAHRIDMGELRSAVAQTSDWKQASGFPLEVESLAISSSLDPAQQVIVDRPERVMLALAPAGQKMFGFAVKAESWTLYDRTAVVHVAMPADTLWPTSVQSPRMEVWQEAWRNWCKQRQLPPNEVEICALNYRPPRLEVQAPARLVQRLQAAKSDLFKGEAWLLAGDGYVRTAAQLAVRS